MDREKMILAFADRIQKQFPEATLTPGAPAKPDGCWWLDIVHHGIHVVIQHIVHIPGCGWGASVVAHPTQTIHDPGFTHQPDNTFDSEESTEAFVVRVLTDPKAPLLASY